MKYRVWDIQNKKFDDGFWVYQGGGVDHDSKYCEETVAQLWTGLKDKNNKDIYEGDILNFTYGCFKFNTSVVFKRGAFMAAGMKLGDEHSACEVIGNIFENPELIK